MEKEEFEKTMSENIQGWIKDKKENRLGGKDLHGVTPHNPIAKTLDQSPTTLNGVLTGKTI